MKKLSKIFLIVLSALLLAGVANAVPISGDVSMFGYADTAFDPMAGIFPDPDGAFVTFASGDFATYLNVGDSVEYNGFVYNPASNPVADPLWSGGGFTFVLNSVTVEAQTANQLILSGSGVLSGYDFEDTYGTWGLSVMQFGEFSFTFSNTTSGATPVPEPASVLIIGIGLIAVAGYGRKRFRKISL